MDMQRMYTQEDIDNIFTDGRDNIRFVEVVDDAIGKRVYVTDYVYVEGELRQEEYNSIQVSDINLNVAPESRSEEIDDILSSTPMYCVDFDEKDYITNPATMREFDRLFELKVEDLYDKDLDENLLVWKAVA